MNPFSRIEYLSSNKNLTLDIADYFCMMCSPEEPFTSLGLVEIRGSAAAEVGGAGNGGDGGGDGGGGRGDGGEVGGSDGDVVSTGGGGALFSFGQMKTCGDAFDTIFLSVSSFSIIKLLCSSYSLITL